MYVWERRTLARNYFSAWRQSAQFRVSAYMGEKQREQVVVVALDIAGIVCRNRRSQDEL